MPFPWKKVKSTRISQLVNDHLHKSQRRRDGSSLVVETGFPTSLIDLFIKNREKLKKPAKKKRQNPPNTPVSFPSPSAAPPPSVAGSPISSPSPSPPPPPSAAESPVHVHSSLHCPSPLRSPSVLPLLPRCVNEIAVVDEKECGDERGVDVNRVLFGVFKMFLVVVLSLATKRLTVGITISAFLLLFLEYVGKHASGLLKPCSEAKGLLRLMVRSVLRLLRFKEVKLDQKNGGVLMLEQEQEYLMMPSSSSLKSSVSRFPDQEIQVVESKSYLVTRVEEIQPENEIREASSFRERLGYQEIESMEVVMEKEVSMCDVAEFKCKSRRAKIKSKMKRFVPKKFKSSRKEHDLQRTEIVKDDSVFSYEELVDQCDTAGEFEIARVSSSISVGRYIEEDGTSEICAFGRLSDVVGEADTKKEEKGRKIEAGLTWRYLALCLIVLIGLIGGRAFALVLTLSWFLLLKLGETLPRYMKVPLIRSFNSKSV